MIGVICRLLMKMPLERTKLLCINFHHSKTSEFAVHSEQQSRDFDDFLD